MRHIPCLPLFVCLAAPPAGANQELMKQGVEACNRGDYASAASYFKQAADAMPQMKLAWQHLANAQVRAYLKARPGPDRAALAGPARDTLETLLAKNTDDPIALWNLSLLEANEERFGDALAAARRLIAVEPANKRAYYTAAVIEWASAYPPLMKAKKSGAPLDGLRARHAAGLAAGHAYLQQALALDPVYADALAYDNLLYRLDAILAATPADADALNRKADEQVKAALRAKEKQPPPSPPPPVKR